MCLLYSINTLKGRKVGGDYSRLSGGHFVEIPHVGHVTPAQCMDGFPEITTDIVHDSFHFCSY